MREPKTLILVRHAKASWSNARLTDHDRPLHARGIRDAPRMAELLSSRGVKPDLIVSSSAVRALTTARVFESELGVGPDALIAEEAVYGADCERLMEMIRETDDHLACVMWVGHNPTFTDVANALVREGVGHLPTCSVVTLALGVDAWNEVGEGRLTLVSLDLPRES
jgi:phosphohistidine phosphatase